MKERGRNAQFQQNSAITRTVRQNTVFVGGIFPGPLSSLFGDIAWPARSPDLTGTDLSPWWDVKSKVYVTCPTALKICNFTSGSELDGSMVFTATSYGEIQPETTGMFPGQGSAESRWWFWKTS